MQAIPTMSAIMVFIALLDAPVRALALAGLDHTWMQVTAA